MATKVKELPKVMELKGDSAGCLTCHPPKKSYITAAELWYDSLHGTITSHEFDEDGKVNLCKNASNQSQGSL